MSSIVSLGNFLEISAAATNTATVTGSLINVSDYIEKMEVFQSVGTVSGTSPTLDGKFQDCVDAVGLGLSNATYDHTGGAAERLLTSTGDFASYTFTAGDQIYLSGAAGGVAEGLYEIASRESDDAIALSANPGLTADSTSDVDSASPADYSGATFTQVTASNNSETIVIPVSSMKKWIRYVGTIAGTTPSFAMAVIGFGQDRNA